VDHDYSPITTAVAKSGGVKTFEMVELLTAHGAGKLGRIVRKEISADLARMGYGHVPADLPNRKVKLVRVFKYGTPVGNVILAATLPAVEHDETLKSIAYHV
jgi:hypothetical protein